MNLYVDKIGILELEEMGIAHNRLGVYYIRIDSWNAINIYV